MSQEQLFTYKENYLEFLKHNLNTHNLQVTI